MHPHPCLYTLWNYQPPLRPLHTQNKMKTLCHWLDHNGSMGILSANIFLETHKTMTGFVFHFKPWTSYHLQSRHVFNNSTHKNMSVVQAFWVCCSHLMVPRSWPIGQMVTATVASERFGASEVAFIWLSLELHILFIVFTYVSQFMPVHVLWTCSAAVDGISFRAQFIVWVVRICFVHIMIINLT